MNTTTQNNVHRRLLFSIAALLLACGCLILPSSALAASDICLSVENDADAATPEPMSESAATAPNCRYGVTASSKGAGDVAALKIGWVVSFGASKPSWLPARVAHTPMIRLKQNRDEAGRRLPTYTASPALTTSGLGRQIQANPGSIWIVGNEVDRVFWQDDLMPEIYADAYHDAYHFIKQTDPTAKVAGLTWQTSVFGQGAGSISSQIWRADAGGCLDVPRLYLCRTQRRL